MVCGIWSARAEGNQRAEPILTEPVEGLWGIQQKDAVANRDMLRLVPEHLQSTAAVAQRM